LPFYHILSTYFCDVDPLRDQDVLAYEVLLALSIDFAAAEHPIMPMCLQLVVKEAYGLHKQILM
jgi:hypothetical protein